MDPAYLVVKNAVAGDAYRRALDAVNAQLPGGTPANPPGGPYIVNGHIDNAEPLRLVDPSLTNLSFLAVDSLANANFVAGALVQAVHGSLHVWVVEAKTGAFLR
jgi:hypothetical protein